MHVLQNKRVVWRSCWETSTALWLQDTNTKFVSANTIPSSREISHFSQFPFLSGTSNTLLVFADMRVPAAITTTLYWVIAIIFPSSPWSGRNASKELRKLLDQNRYDKRFRPEFEGKLLFQDIIFFLLLLLSFIEQVNWKC